MCMLTCILHHLLQLLKFAVRFVMKTGVGPCLPHSSERFCVSLQYFSSELFTWSTEFRVQSSEFSIQSSGFRVQSCVNCQTDLPASFL